MGNVLNDSLLCILYSVSSRNALCCSQRYLRYLSFSCLYSVPYFFNQKIKLRVRGNSTGKLGLHHGSKVPQKPFLPGLSGIDIIMPGNYINIIIPEVLSAITLEQHCMVS